MFNLFRRGNSEPNLESEVLNFYNKLVESIRNTTEIYLFTHLYPDLDSVCSNIAMAIIVKKINPRSNIYLISEHKFPSRTDNLLAEMPEWVVSRVDSGIDSYDYRRGVTIALDFNDPSRISKGINAQNFYDKFDWEKIFCIDHHEKPNLDGYMYSELREASTCSMVYKFYKNLDIELDIETKRLFFRLIWYGILSDTNSLTRPVSDQGRDTIRTFMADFNGFGRNELENASEIYQRSEDPREQIFRDTYVRNTVIYEGGVYKIAGTFMTLGESLSIGKDYNKSINGADEITSITETYVSFCVDELGQGRYKVSFRPCNGLDIDVSNLALEFGGGGHKHMSAATINSENELKELCQEIARRCHNWLCLNYQNS